jgi:predicted transcriptional regulator
MAGSKTGRSTRSVEKEDRNTEIERLLVEGELVTDTNGAEVRAYPLAYEVAERLGVSKSWVSKYARQNRCLERRAVFQHAVKTQVRDKIVRSEANRVAFERAEQLALCDQLLAKYTDAIESREVGNVTATDINAIVRLRHFISGDADSRAEVTHGVTLEMMQAAHREALRTVHIATPEERGRDDANVFTSNTPLASSFDEAGQESEVHQEVDQKLTKQEVP